MTTNEAVERLPATDAGRTFLAALEAQDAMRGETTPVDWVHGILAIEAEAHERSAGAVPEHRPNDGCGELLWEHMSAQPGFDEELEQARAELAEGRGVPFYAAERSAGAAEGTEGSPEHVTDADDPLACWCGPYRDTEEPMVVIHRKEGEA